VDQLLLRLLPGQSDLAARSHPHRSQSPRTCASTGSKLQPSQPGWC
jgi:hypothetical protein